MFYVLHISFLLLILDSHLDQQLDLGIPYPSDLVLSAAHYSASLWPGLHLPA